MAILDPMGNAQLSAWQSIGEMRGILEEYRASWQVGLHLYATEAFTWFAVLEHIHVMPRIMRGVTAAFKLGVNFGQWEGLLNGLNIPFRVVSPQRWQKFLGLRAKGDKRITRECAERLYPGMRITHKTADALLLAHYASLTEGGFREAQAIDQAVAGK